MRRYPAILIGRLAVNEDFAEKGLDPNFYQFLNCWLFIKATFQIAVSWPLMPRMIQSLFTTTRKTISSIYIPAKNKKPAT